MGGFFTPDPPPPSPPPPPVIVTDPEAEAAQARQDAIARNRRGLAGTIATSETGLLQPSQGVGKSLLGE
ncbi:hypothetical protein A6A04_01800 [Paramagnetospirillum marisnigri]|uniref:Uncharacterized protein n=1 Tax=Paramagnetospirillum marisnigri TaxID=1285242 RepID=A0A178MNK5_9PROT|nr:hypothetical protein [Paramagnetospirillum marisnigri]OAN50360.1 hypothetical protein A6A04_01800 [Paramagnetospirillum marisnigri]